MECSLGILPSATLPLASFLSILAHFAAHPASFIVSVLGLQSFTGTQTLSEPRFLFLERENLEAKPSEIWCKKNMKVREKYLKSIKNGDVQYSRIVLHYLLVIDSILTNTRLTPTQGMKLTEITELCFYTLFYSTLLEIFGIWRITKRSSVKYCKI